MVPPTISYNTVHTLTISIFIRITTIKYIPHLYLALRFHGLQLLLSPTNSQVARSIQPIRNFISPSNLFSRLLAPCAPFHVVIVHPSPIDRRSPPQPRLRSRSSIYTSVWGARGPSNLYLACPIILGQYIYGLTCNICGSPKHINFNLRSHRCPTIIPCLYFIPLVSIIFIVFKLWSFPSLAFI